MTSACLEHVTLAGHYCNFVLGLHCTCLARPDKVLYPATRLTACKRLGTGAQRLTVTELDETTIGIPNPAVIANRIRLLSRFPLQNTCPGRARGYFIDRMLAIQGKSQVRKVFRGLIASGASRQKHQDKFASPCRVAPTKPLFCRGSRVDGRLSNRRRTRKTTHKHQGRARAMQCGSAIWTY